MPGSQGAHVGRETCWGPWLLPLNGPLLPGLGQLLPKRALVFLPTALAQKAPNKSGLLLEEWISDWLPESARRGNFPEGLSRKGGLLEVKVKNARVSEQSGQGAEQVESLGPRDLKRETALAWEGQRGWRGGPITHVALFIIGEIKKGKVTGFHNWIRFYMQEKEGLVDYYSHIYDGPVSTEC